MSENPLLPHKRLRELHQKMLVCRELERKQRQRSKISGCPAREALLAVAAMHLVAGDLLSARTEDRTPLQLAPEAKKHSSGGILLADNPLTQRVPLCAAAARGMQAAGTESLVLALTQTGDREPGWQAALEWAQRAQLPLLLICEDASGGARSSKRKGRQDVLDFEAITQLAKRTKLPVLPVDGEDAVAVYRVLQECVLRTRMGGGPAVVWAVLTPVSSRLPKLKRSASPLGRLQRYMTSRAIPFAKTSI